MPRKHSDTARVEGPGASHENRQNPEKSQPRGERPEMTKSPRHSGVSGGGGERDSHQARDPSGKGGAW